MALFNKFYTPHCEIHDPQLNLFKTNPLQIKYIYYYYYYYFIIII